MDARYKKPDQEHLNHMGGYVPHIQGSAGQEWGIDSGVHEALRLFVFHCLEQVGYHPQASKYPLISNIKSFLTDHPL